MNTLLPALLLAILFSPAWGLAQNQGERSPHAEPRTEFAFQDDDDERDEEEDEDHDEEEEFEEIPPPSAKEVKSFIRRELPELAKRLPGIQEEDPEHVEEIMDHMGDILHEYLHLQREEPDFAEPFLNIEKMETALHFKAEAFHESEGKQREAARRAFHKSLAEWFDAHLAMEKRHLEHMEMEIRTIRREIKKMEKNRDEEIDHQVREWLGEDEEEDEDDEEEDER